MVTEGSPLHDVLQRFETALLTPQVAGEISEWAQSLAAAWMGLCEQVGHEVVNEHRGQIKDIGRTDPELLSKVKELKAEDAAIIAECETFGRRIEELKRMSSVLEKEENPVQKAAAGIVEEGAKFLTRVKKQELAIRTYFMESFNRDRGIGD